MGGVCSLTKGGGVNEVISDIVFLTTWIALLLLLFLLQKHIKMMNMLM